MFKTLWTISRVKNISYHRVPCHPAVFWCRFKVRTFHTLKMFIFKTTLLIYCIPKLIIYLRTKLHIVLMVYRFLPYNWNLKKFSDRRHLFILKCTPYYFNQINMFFQSMLPLIIVLSKWSSFNWFRLASLLSAIKSLLKTIHAIVYYSVWYSLSA
jgi:hypothetical protein